MAQLKDLIVAGASRFIGDVYANKIQLTSLSAPTSAGGTTYSAGTDGQVLKSNGTSLYWAADNNSDVNVTQTITTTNAAYRLLFSATADDTTRAEAARKDTDLRWNPSTNTLDIAASNANGVIQTTSGTFTMKSASTLYLNGGSSASTIFQKNGTEMARFNTSGNLIIGASSGQNDITDYKLYVNGQSEFNVGTSDTTNEKKFVIYGNNRFLSFGGSGVQAYSGTLASPTASVLYVNYYGGSIQIGTETNAMTSGNFYGTYDFKTSSGFTYSGMGAGTTDLDRPVWFMAANGSSLLNGRPVYDTDFKYNPSSNTLTVANVAGNATSATKANITSTAYGVAYYSDATGTFASTTAGTAGYPFIASGASAAPAWYAGATFSGNQASNYAANFAGTTDSTTTSTGAVKIAGGLGVAKQATINNAKITATTASTTTATGALIVSGGVGVGGQVTATRIGAGGSNTSYNLYVNGNSSFNGRLVVSTTNYSTSAPSGDPTSGAGTIYFQITS